MDPTARLVEIIDSFSPKFLEKDKLPPAYTVSPSEIIPDIQVTDSFNLPPDPTLCNVEDYDRLQKQKDVYNLPGFLQARDKTNPYENLGNSIFMNRAAVKLANIDALYNLTQVEKDPLIPTYRGPFTFGDIAAGPGGFTQYLLWRRPEAQGIGMTLKPSAKESHLDWDRRHLDLKRFKITYGADGTGNLYTNWTSFVNEVLTTHKQGLDLVTADGGFDVESIQPKPGEKSIEKSTENYARQEFLSSRLIICELLTAINVLKVGGIAMIKVFDTVTSLSAQVVYLAAICSESISLIKPISSRPANSERYLVLHGLRDYDVTEKITELLETANNSYIEDSNVVNLFSNQLPREFTRWLKSNNDLSINRQLDVSNDILSVLDGEEYTPQPVNLQRAFVVWNIPDNPRGKSDRIRI